MHVASWCTASMHSQYIGYHKTHVALDQRPLLPLWIEKPKKLTLLITFIDSLTIKFHTLQVQFQVVFMAVRVHFCT